jgi:hypothetical protein
VQKVSDRWPKITYCVIFSFLTDDRDFQRLGELVCEMLKRPTSSTRHNRTRKSCLEQTVQIAERAYMATDNSRRTAVASSVKLNHAFLNSSVREAARRNLKPQTVVDCQD